MNDTLNETIVNVVNDTVIPMILGQSVPVTSSPVIDIAILALVGAFFTTLVNKFLSDQVKIKALRVEMKTLQKKVRDMMKTDPKKAQSLQGDIMKKNMENMKHALNPKVMIITMIPMLFLFFFIRTHYAHMGEFLNLGFTTFGWLGTYFVFSIISSLILKKVLDVA
jgi:uncharacterized membrane protein (DUF106 family)